MREGLELVDAQPGVTVACMQLKDESETLEQPGVYLGGEAGSGKWEVGSGKWEVGSGKRAVGSGQWEVGSGKWEVGSGKWEVGNGT